MGDKPMANLANTVTNLVLGEWKKAVQDYPDATHLEIVKHFVIAFSLVLSQMVYRGAISPVKMGDPLVGMNAEVAAIFEKVNKAINAVLNEVASGLSEG